MTFLCFLYTQIVNNIQYSDWWLRHFIITTTAIQISLQFIYVKINKIISKANVHNNVLGDITVFVSQYN